MANSPRVRILVLIGLMLMSLTACHRRPVRHLTSDVCLLLPGSTTRQEVLAYLGGPDQRRMDPQQGETWIYYQANKTLLRKTPYIGDNLGEEQYDVVIVTFQGDLVRTCAYRSLSGEEFKKAGIPEGAPSGS